MAQVVGTHILAVAPTGSSAPDSITIGGGSIWVEYGNGADSTGASGDSTIVQYNMLGQVESTYTIPGLADGLKYDPATGNVWALLNNDGNATLRSINPATHQVSGTLTYGSGYVYGPSSGRGFDDVVFDGSTVFMSETNPANQGDPVVVELLNGAAPFGTLETQGILSFGDTGTNLVTGQTNQTLPITDPDSLKLLPNGELLLTGEADGAYIFIKDPGTAQQTESFVKMPAGFVGDDAIMPSATSGTFYISNQGANNIVRVTVTGLNTNDLYADIASKNELVQIDPTTGAITPIVTGLSNPHGLAFVPATPTPSKPKTPTGPGTASDPVVVTSQHILAVAPTGSSAPDSITIGGGSIWVEYGNGADSTGASGSSTIVQYSMMGQVENSYTITGLADGLKYDPATGNVWVLLNNDGNATLRFIDPATKEVSGTLKYGSGYVYGANSGRGFDDVVFDGSAVFLSETNPANPGDPVVVQLLNGAAPFGTLETQGILSFGDTGTNLVTGQTNQTLPITDPDSLKLLPNGELLLTGEADGAYIFIQDPGTPQQTESFVKMPAGFVGDDAIMPSATSGTFYISNQGANDVVRVTVTGLNTSDLYADIASKNELVQIDPTIGKITPIVTGLNNPHGLAFVPAPGSTPSTPTVPSVPVSTSGPVVWGQHILAVAPTGSSAPDSITIGGGSIWVEYGNGADSTGASGSSTIVQYSMLGQVQNTYTITGLADGLKYDPATGNVWVLLNNDGNATLSFINPATHQVSGTLKYGSGYVYGPTSGRGFDDVVFDGNNVFLSETNPVNPGDPVVVELLNGAAPFGTLKTQGILSFGDTGTNLVTGQTNQTLPITDPDSLKLLPNGELLLTGEADGAYIFIKDPGTSQQTESFVKMPAGFVGDDAIMPSATSGTFYISNQGGNDIIRVNVTGLNTNDLYADITSKNELVQIDPTTGKITPIVTGLNSPHGLEFVPAPTTPSKPKPLPAPDPTPGPVVTGQHILAVAPTGSSAPDSITIGGGSIWVEYGNGADSTGASGSSTIVQYSMLGQVENSYTITGLADGLKYDPATGNVWVLLNNDGNATLRFINPATDEVSSTLKYGSGYVYGANSGRGFDDVVFDGNRVFLSETNPANAGDPVIVQLLNGAAPFGTLETQSILSFGDTGTNLITGVTNQTLPMTDPDSLKLLPNGDLLLTGEADGAYIFVKNPGTSQQTESFVKMPAGFVGDDAIMPSASSGTFYISNQGANDIIRVSVTGLNTNDLYADIASKNALVQIDPTTGRITTVVAGLNNPHGLDFVASAASSTTSAASLVPTYGVDFSKLTADASGGGVASNTHPAGSAAHDLAAANATASAWLDATAHHG